ncbi:MAG: nitrogen fixation protein NifQ [Rhodoferax sp.]|uniref:nitrogen fixation protein NifQ n=1 Tax=Rhodoferax sp. TaxID=50421 RepID=UPI0027344F85|nr:nitrogen fixation protein NifQ [Rhodoferax sp.]MDP2679621.1 nitrogen fixation protein NifQ [Rhodoferax sp.]
MNPSHDCRSLLMAELLNRPATAQAVADPLRPVLASLLVGRSLHQGVLTAALGLSGQAFQTLWHDYFPGEHLALQNGPGEDIAELEDLLNLLLEYRAGLRESEVWLAHIVAYSCCGRNHLWQDLGLAHRNELSVLMTTAFPALASLNVGDMKWKKFIYHFYCNREGIYVCPVPSCAECADHAKCFSPEV